jgi:hypothetical protein
MLHQYVWTVLNAFDPLAQGLVKLHWHHWKPAYGVGGNDFAAISVSEVKLSHFWSRMLESLAYIAR